MSEVIEKMDQIEKRLNSIESKLPGNGSGRGKAALPGSRLPLWGALAFILLGVVLEIYYNDVRITIFITLGAMTLVQCCLDVYKGKDKPLWSIAARVVTLLFGLLGLLTTLNH